MAGDQLARVPLGSTGLMVLLPSRSDAHRSVICRRPLPTGVSEEDASRLYARRLPVRWITSTPRRLYGDGESERRIGHPYCANWVDCRRTRLSRPSRVAIPRRTITAARRSNAGSSVVLNHLDIDKVHTCFLHDAEWTTFEEAMAPGGPISVLKSFQEQGAIDFLGVASGPVSVEIQYVETGIFDCLITHNRYTLLHKSKRVAGLCCRVIQAWQCSTRLHWQRHVGQGTGRGTRAMHTSRLRMK